jgi:hypothetical protein
LEENVASIFRVKEKASVKAALLATCCHAGFLFSLLTTAVRTSNSTLYNVSLNKKKKPSEFLILICIARRAT